MTRMKDITTFLTNFLFTVKDRRFAYSFSIDFIFLLVAGALFYFFFILSETRALALRQLPLNQIQQMLLTAPAEAEAIISSVNSYLIFFFSMGFLLILLIFFLFSMTRALQWNYLSGKRFFWRKHWRWNLLNLTLLLPLLLYLIIYALVRIIINLTVIPGLQQSTIVNLNAAINFAFFLAFLFYFFLVNYSFVEKPRTWEAVGKGFSLLKKKWSLLWRAFVMFLIVVLLLSLLLAIFYRAVYIPSILTQLINLVVFLLIIAYIRVYLYRVLTSK